MITILTNSLLKQLRRGDSNLVPRLTSLNHINKEVQKNHQSRMYFATTKFRMDLRAKLKHPIPQACRSLQSNFRIQSMPTSRELVRNDRNRQVQKQRERQIAEQARQCTPTQHKKKHDEAVKEAVNQEKAEAKKTRADTEKAAEAEKATKAEADKAAKAEADKARAEAEANNKVREDERLKQAEFDEKNARLQRHEANKNKKVFEEFYQSNFAMFQLATDLNGLSFMQDYGRRLKELKALADGKNPKLRWNKKNENNND
jgi:uncharacterized membrane protein YqiK